MEAMKASPADQEVRDRLIRELDTTFFVEAAAGTGKTTIVVDRIIELIAHGRLVISRLVAITFTEAAAAELRARVREAVEDAAIDLARPIEQRERCKLASEAIEDASIDTIHAFAAYILQTFPLEAGLPPGFEVLEPIQEQLEFHDLFRAWFDQAAGDPSLREPLRRALLLGLEPNHIRAAAAAMQAHYDLLTPDMRWPEGTTEDPISLAHRLGAQIRDLMPLLDYGPEGPVSDAVRSIQFAGARLTAATNQDEALRALIALAWRKNLRKVGRQEEWQIDQERGANALLLIRQDWQDLTQADELVSASRKATLSRLLPEVTAFLLDWANARKREGRATFHDLLTWARNLVHDNGEIRRRLQEHFTHILVDEFQDTDPLQAELVMYLAAPAGQPLPEHWTDIAPVPGKLFIVGDPKQSIYHFRRADLALYEALQGRVGRLEKLTSNFRSVPDVVEWINLHFSERMFHQAGAQPHYSPLKSEQPPSEDSVWVIGDAMAGVDQRSVWQAEARALASVARQAVEDGWLVSEKLNGKRVLRPATFSDVTLLVPSRANLRRIQDAFERADVPYLLESGELILATQEVRDLLSCLRAMDDPSDQVALVAALRSPAYGCSDLDLLRWVEGRGRLTYDYFAASPAESTVVRSALEDLLRWHHQRNSASVASLIERFVDERMLAVAAVADRRPAEVWRRYRHLIERARTFATTGRTSLRAYLDWMDDLRDENQLALPGAPEESEDDAVRVLTVHGAKGLEFPIVLLSGWHSRRNFTAPLAIPDWVNGSMEVACGYERSFKSVGYDAATAAERALTDCELIRLTYVATTRARDHLVVSLFRKDDTKEAGHLAHSLVGFDKARRLEVNDWPAERHPSDAVTADPPGDRSLRLSQSEEVRQQERDELAWLESRTSALRSLRGMPVVSATTLAHLPQAQDLEPPAEVAALRRGRGGTSLGRAVHAVLQVADLHALSNLEQLSRAQAAAEGIEHRWQEVATLARRAAQSDAVRRAVSGPFWREVPVAVTLEGIILEGYVDLVYETPGGLGIVDYKTDSVSPAEADKRMDQYRIQGEAYRVALQIATGLDVPEVTFVFASLPGHEVTVRTSEELRDQVLNRLTAVT
jgi:ATP-dependent helicase/nuclease subunit A